MVSHLYIIIVLTVLDYCTSEPNADTVDYTLDAAAEERFRSGEMQYKEIISHYSSLPQYGECWTRAVKSLESGCKQLTPDIQSRLAIRFTSCFRQGHGLSSVPCDDGEDLSACTERMDERAYQTFSSYFTHTQNMCYYLQSQIWNDETRKTVSHLSSASRQVMKKLKDSADLQQQLKVSQQSALDKQERILESGERLGNFLESSSKQVQHVFSELQASTREHEFVIGEIFSKVERLQSMVLGEFTGFYTVLYYCMALIACYLLTSAPRTSSARFWLFSIVTANAILERIVVREAVTESQDLANPVTESLNDVVYYRVSVCRKVSAVLALTTLILCAWRFTDLARVNNQLLLQIQRQNQEMAHYIRGEVQGRLANGSIPSALTEHTTSRSPLLYQLSSAPISLDMIDNCSNLPDDDSEMSDDDSSSASYDSVRTDVSYRPHPPAAAPPSPHSPWLSPLAVGRRVSELLPRAVITSPHPTSQTPTTQTPTTPTTSTPTTSGTQPTRQRSRSKTPSMVRTYNLRNRTVSPQAPSTLLGSETEREFASQVNQTLRETQRNASILRRLTEREREREVDGR